MPHFLLGVTELLVENVIGDHGSLRRGIIYERTSWNFIRIA